MAGNRKRHTNIVQVGSLLKWVVAVVFLGIAGLSYVYLSNQMHKSYRELGRLEDELKRVNGLSVEADTKIAQLTSRTALQRRLNEKFIVMMPITDDHIVRIAAPPHSAGNELRAVSNRGIEK